MGVGKKFRAEPAVGKSEENVSNIPERQIFGTGSQEPARQSVGNTLIQNYFQRVTWNSLSSGHRLPEERRDSSPGLQFLPIYYNSRVQVYNFCQLITTLDSRSTNFASISQLSSPGLQFCQYITTLESRSKIFANLSQLSSPGLQFFGNLSQLLFSESRFAVFGLFCHDFIFDNQDFRGQIFFWFQSATYWHHVYLFLASFVFSEQRSTFFLFKAFFYQASSPCKSLELSENAFSLKINDRRLILD